MDGDAQPDSIKPLIAPDFQIRGAATRANDEARQKKDAAIENCTICLQSIAERAVVLPCNHLTFDLWCLATWFQERATCPLCKVAVTEVQYDWCSPEDYKTYHVPKPESPKASSREELLDRETQRGSSHFAGRRTPEIHHARAAREDPTVEQRRRIYRHRLYSLHVGANRISRHRDFTHETFATSPDLQSRARAFLRRELQVFSFLETAAAPRGGNRSFLVEYVVAVLKANELKGASGHAEDLLAEFLGRDNTRLFLHELEAWLRSPHARLEEWDREVQYADTSRVAKSHEG
ncbi:hypothetical protein LTR08_008323 [Meristemomyces frigidus]|nr:hypothetical protein LTR08_008323 [Meristemomyces frigidus]